MRRPPSHRMTVVPNWTRIMPNQVVEAATPVAIVNSTLVLRAHSWGLVDAVGRLREKIVAAVNARQEGEPRLTGLVVLNPEARVVGRGKAS